MIKILIDNTTYEVSEGKNLLETCIALGINLPYFCYHPAMGSVGACRQCAVKKYTNADDQAGKIVMACMEPVTDGMLISVTDIEASDFRASVIEGLMTNHPHDCPVCDEGGECHLQDMTLMTGHNYRRYDFKKRTYVNQNLGPFIHHEMNRCIQCYRCVRFYRDYAGGKDLNVFSSANRVYFGREKDGMLENEFSGNLVEVCPTGVFTDKTLQKHYTRKWDLTNTPSVCVHCSLGCNTLLGERYRKVRRVMSRYNGDVNKYFLCDRGRFGYEYMNDPSKVKMLRIKKSPDVSTESYAVSDIASSFKKGEIIGIGSPRASLESNFALLSLVGSEKFFQGIQAEELNLNRRALELMESSLVHTPSLSQCEEADCILILGEDITQTAPVLALALRQAARNKALRVAEKAGIHGWNDAPARVIAQDVRTPLFIASAFGTKLDDIAAGKWHGSPSDIARLGFAVAHAIHAGAPEIKEQDKIITDLAGNIAKELLAAEKPLIVAGTISGNEQIFDAVNNIVAAISASGKKPWVTFAFRECNSAGLAMMGGGSLNDALGLIGRNDTDTVIILENDLYLRLPAEQADAFFQRSGKTIVIDHLSTETSNKAWAVIPAATVAESSGTFVNNEGRAQRFYPVMPAFDPVKDSWKWITELMALAGTEQENPMTRFDDVVSSLTKYYPRFAGIRNHLPNAGIRYYNEKIARQTPRFSGRTAITAHVSVNEPAPPDDPDSPLKFSMEGYKGEPPSNLIPYYWSPGWNSPQAINKYLDEPNGSVKDSDPGIRLLNNTGSGVITYAKNIPQRAPVEKGKYITVAAPRIFGSEELSSRAKGIAEVIPDPFVLLNSNSLKNLNSVENDILILVIDDHQIRVTLKTDDLVPDDMMAISWPLPGMPWLRLPSQAVFSVKPKL